MHSVYSLVFINGNIKYVFWQCFKICYKSFLFVNSFENFVPKSPNIDFTKSKILVLFIQNFESILSDIIWQITFCIINIMFNGTLSPPFTLFPLSRNSVYAVSLVRSKKFHICVFTCSSPFMQFYVGKIRENSWLIYNDETFSDTFNLHIVYDI